MRIDLNLEKERVLSTQEIYEIIDFATQAAEDNGFMNSFIFQRALYLFAAIRLYEDRKDEIAHLVAENVNSAWDILIKDGTIEDMIERFDKELVILEESGEVWLEEFTAYAHSARGLLNTIQEFTGDIVKQAAEQLQNVTQESNLQEVFEIADKWGMNNELLEDSQDTLFTEE